MISVLQTYYTLLIVFFGAGCACRPLPYAEEALPDLSTARDLAAQPDISVPRDIAAPQDISAPVDLAGPVEKIYYGWPGPFPAALVLGENVVFAWRVQVLTVLTLEALGLVAGEPDGRIRLVLYDDEGDQPGALLVATAASDPIVVPGPVEIAVPARTLSPGSYWIAVRTSPRAMPVEGALARRCVRRTTVIGLDSDWPTGFGMATCYDDVRAAGLYLVGRARAAGDLGSVGAPDPGSSDGGAAGILGWPSPLPSPLAYSNSKVLAVPLEVARPTTLDRFGIIAAASGGEYRLALYSDASGEPSQLLSSMAAPRPLVAGANQLDVFDRPLPAGRYWLAIRTRPTVLLRTGGDERLTLCERMTTIPSLDSAWPDDWGSSWCQRFSPINVYLITR